MSPEPEAVLQLLACRCVRSCNSSDCPSLSNGWEYTDICKIQTCNNQEKDKEADAELQDLPEDDDE